MAACMQAPPGEHLWELLEEGPAALTGLAPGHATRARALYDKGDSYYYRSIARMQRLWQVRQ